MTCTECKTTGHITLNGVMWNAEYGYIIHKEEYLCDNCAEKRPGFLMAGDLLRQKEKQLSIKNRYKIDE